MQLGLTPFAVGFPARGLEGAYDSIGLCRLSADGWTYVSIYDPRVTLETTTARVLRELSGDQVDVRLGAYAPTEGMTRFEEDVALDFVKEGFRRMGLVRETTDNNNYANNVMTRGYIERALCLAGYKDAVPFQQSRQVGRTPEYDLALLHVAGKNFDNLPRDSEVARGPRKGTKVVVAVDAHPDELEKFDATTYRVFSDPADNLVGAWDSFEAYISTQDVPRAHLAEHSEAVSPAVLFGPCRTIVNRPATFTPPVTERRLNADEVSRLRAFVYNEASRDWNPVFGPAGSAPLRYDAKRRTATLDTQVFGVFALAVTPPGWTPTGAIRHRYHQTPPVRR